MVDAFFPTGSAKTLSQGERALRDLVEGLIHWRIWHSMALNDIRQRYRRSRIGQFWLTISMAITIVGMGTVFSTLFRVKPEEYMPYVGCSLTIWALISSLVVDLSSSCIQGDAYLRNYPSPRCVVFFRTIMRNFILFAHNLIIIPPLLIFGQIPISWSILLSVVGMALLALNAVWIGMLLGPLCARFRDLQQIIQNVMTLAMYMTPVMWHVEQLGGRFPLLTRNNPFNAFLELVRAPLLGRVPELHYYLFVLLITVIGFGVAVPFYAAFRRRIVYWL
ncbi:MAG: ABC transporter permease [Pseudomonadota bacterium]